MVDSTGPMRLTTNPSEYLGEMESSAHSPANHESADRSPGVGCSDSADGPPRIEPGFDELIHIAERIVARQMEVPFVLNSETDLTTRATGDGLPGGSAALGGGDRDAVHSPEREITRADREADRLTVAQLEALRGIGRQATALLDMRRRASTFGSVLERDRNRAAELNAWQDSHDALTALPVRAELERRISQIADAAQLNGREPEASVVVIDVNGVGEVNAAFGRGAGDAVIRELAWVLAECLPADALLSRTDGTEFAAIVPDADLSLAGVIAQEIHSRLAEPIHADGVDPVTLGAVIGSASSGENGAIEARDLLAAAEAAASEAKGLGPRSTVAAGSDTVSAQAREARMRTALTAAIRRGVLTVAYMPLVRLDDREISGCEALARWRDPEFGNVSPVEFIALAEQHGMVREIDDLLLATALRDFADGLIEAPLVAVNISPTGIDPDLPRRVSRALADAGVSPECLSVEITERAALADSPETWKALAELKELGVKVALDDFGAGMTSLAHLRTLPITQLKIDRSLTVDLIGPDAERARMVVEAIASMASGLGLETFAEGIEHEAQAEALQAAGVRFGQGFLFGRAAAVAPWEERR